MGGRSPAAMTGVRHHLLALLAVLGLLSALGWTAGAAACPADPHPVMHADMPMAMNHQHQHGSGQAAPDEHAMAACPACLAVMPSRATADPIAPAGLAPLTLAPASFASFDPGLDPPPPRAS